MHITRTPLTLTAIALLAALGLAGCASAAPTADGSSPAASAPETTISSPTPSDTPTTDPAPATVDDLVLTPDGIGDLVIGSDVPADTALLKKGDMCELSSSSTDDWVNVFASGDTGLSPFFILPWQVDRGPIEGIYINDAAVRTADGLHIGSTVAELEAGGARAYGDGTETNGSWILPGTTGQLEFVVDHGKVVYTAVTPLGSKPFGGFGPCS